MASTVVLQSVQVYDSAVSDIAVSVSPLAQTTGSGRALVLRDGRAFPAVWSQPSTQAGNPNQCSTPTGVSLASTRTLLAGVRPGGPRTAPDAC